MGHIINLAVNSFLFVDDEDYVELDHKDITLTESLSEIQNWRKFGPLGKLHNVIVNI